MEKSNKNYWIWLLFISSIFVGQIYRNGLNDIVSYLMLGAVIFSLGFICFRLVIKVVQKEAINN